MSETMYEVTTSWGHFRLDERAYRDYLQGKLWISSSPKTASSVIKHELISDKLTSSISQEAIELKNQASASGVLSVLQHFDPATHVPVPYKSYMSDISIEELNLSVRASNGLMRSGVKTLGLLMMLMESEKGIKGIRNLGLKSVKEIQNAFFTCTYNRLSNSEKAFFWQQILDSSNIH